jgi:hypothetical protein
MSRAPGAPASEPNRVNQLMVMFNGIASCYTRLFMRQFEKHGTDLSRSLNRPAGRNCSSSPKNHRPAPANHYSPHMVVQKYGPSAIMIQNIFFRLIIFALIKYSLIQLLWNVELLADFRGLDCFILGRLKYFGRTDRISWTMAMWAIVLLIERHLVCRSSWMRRFHFHAFEFLLHNYDEVRLIELAYLEHGQQRSLPEAGTSPLASTHRLEAGCPSHQADKSVYVNYNNESIPNGIRYNLLFHFRNPFAAGADGVGCQFILRPNRTSNSWLVLTRMTRLSFWLSIMTCVSWFVVVFIGTFGSMLSDAGFETSYASCVVWLRAQRRQNASEWALELIYRPPEVLAHELPLEQMPALVLPEWGRLKGLSVYHALRIVLDLTETYFLFFQFLFHFLITFYTATLISLDILLNVREIWRDMKALIDRLELNKLNPNKLVGTPKTNPFSVLEDRRLAGDISHVQAKLADHQALIKSYNSLMSYTFTKPIIWWASYNLVVCIWIGSLKNQAATNELLWVEVFASVLMLSILFTAAVTRSQNKLIYGLITRLMALDSNNVMTKRRWNKVLSFFSGSKPMFCFKLFDSYEVSWFFCVKVSSSRVVSRCPPPPARCAVHVR